MYAASVQNSSTHSLASELSDEEAHAEDAHGVTQIHQIAGRQTISKAVGGLIPRRLSRSQSANVMSSRDASMVIGISVQEATVEAAEDDTSNQAMVHASGSLNRQGWLTKAKSFTKKFRRKSKLGLTDSIS